MISDLQQQLKEKDKEIEKLQRLVKAWSDECERKFSLLQDNTKQVCEKIRDLAGDYFEISYCDNCGEQPYDDVILTGNDLTEILDQIEKGG